MPILCSFTLRPVPVAVCGEPAIPAQPSKLLIDAVTTLEACKSISAKIVHEVYLFDKHLVGSGSYWGQRRGGDHRMRMELKVRLGRQTSSLVQVCDGSFLWTRKKLPNEDKLTRLDVARAKAGLKRAKELGRPASMGMLPGIGGLPRLFRGLHGTFDFTAVELGTWGSTKQPVWKIEGQWKPHVLLQILPAQKATIESGQPPDLSKLPPHLPDRVVVFLLARKDLFPFRVEYRRTLPEGPDSDRLTSRTLVAMELSDIDINLPLDPNHFIYNPGQLDFTDATPSFLKSLQVEP